MGGLQGEKTCNFSSTMRERWGNLMARKDCLQTALQKASLVQERFHVSGRECVVHLKPRIDDLARYTAKINLVKQKIPELDIYRRPNVEKSLDQRFGIQEKCQQNYRPSLRVIVSGLHTEDAIKSLILRLESVASEGDWQ